MVDSGHKCSYYCENPACVIAQRNDLGEQLVETIHKITVLKNAVRKMHAAKGRYHTQIATCDLYDLVSLPNVRPTPIPQEDPTVSMMCRYLTGNEIDAITYAGVSVHPAAIQSEFCKVNNLKLAVPGVKS